MGWLIALGVLTLIALIPLGVRFRYDVDGPKLFLMIGPAAVKVELGHKEKKKEKKEQRPKEKTERTGAKPQKTEGGSLKDFLPIVKTALSFLDDFRRKLRITRLDAKVILGGDDPCDLALTYGNAQAIVAGVMPLLENYFTIKKRNVEVECDFTSEETKVFLFAALSIPLYLLVYLLGRYGIRAVRQYLSILNKRKGGAKNEYKTSKYVRKYHRKNP